MEPSEKLWPRVFAAVAPLVLSAIACAQVTGLSDDYRFDLADGGAPIDDASVAPDGEVLPPDANDGSASERCGIVDRTNASEHLSAGGSAVPQDCTSCMAGACCSEVIACATDATCSESMRCVLACQARSGSGSKRQCLSACNGAFFESVNTCVEQQCAASTCALR